MVKIEKDVDGNPYVVIDTIQFKGKRSIDWHEVECYLKGFRGRKYRLNGDVVHIDGRFADEFCWSKDSKRLMGTLAKAKANVVQAIEELFCVASNERFQENMDEKHNKNAKDGWYRYTCRFALPVMSENGQVERYNLFRIEMLVRCASNGLKYLYDFINIKKETSKPS